MKKLVVALACLLIATVASAQQEREILLTPNGTLYSVERAWAADYPGISVTSNSFLTLNERRAGNTTRYIVPGTLVSGVHLNPALAFDEVTGTVFLFWQHKVSALSSDLYFTSFNDGVWSQELTFASARNHRSNLRIALTRKVTVQQGDAATTLPEVNVHAVWWEYDTATRREAANYALLTVQNGVVTAPETTYKLRDLLPAQRTVGSEQTQSEASEAAEALRHPALFTNPTQDSVDVLFGNTKTESLHRLTIRPTKLTLDARIRIPIGVKGHPLNGTPKLRGTAADTRLAALTGGSGDVAIYTYGADAVQYSIYKDAKWSEPRTIALDAQLNADAAVAAVRRLISQE